MQLLLPTSVSFLSLLLLEVYHLAQLSAIHLYFLLVYVKVKLRDCMDVQVFEALFRCAERRHMNLNTILGNFSQLKPLNCNKSDTSRFGRRILDFADQIHCTHNYYHILSLHVAFLPFVFLDGKYHLMATG